MGKKLNIVFILADEHGKLIQNEEAVTKEQYGSNDKLERLNLKGQGYIDFSNTVSPGVSTIQSVESIMSGIYAAKAHMHHYRAWPEWDCLENPVLGGFLEDHGYEVIGFSSLFNANNWLPCLPIKNPAFYKEFSPVKRDIYSNEVIMAAVSDYFVNTEQNDKLKLFVVHSALLFTIWDDMMNLFFLNGYNYDNTIFIVTSDHNLPQGFRRYYLYFLARFGLELYHHTDLTEYNTRVIFHLKYPGSKGVDIKTQVGGYDIVPTLLDLIGMKDMWPAKFDGVSLLPLIESETIPDRMIRVDNLYPYQIGREQGRITSIRSEKYKYINRPDPASSYISYRMTESWPLVLKKEEFYDIEDDIWEKRNLIDSEDVAIQREVEKHREFLKESNGEILNFHVESLRNMFRKKKLLEMLFEGKKHGRMLCIETCPGHVFKSIISVFEKELPGWGIDVVLKKRDAECVNDIAGIENRFIYPDDSVYDSKVFKNTIFAALNEYYDVILSTSNFPMGDYEDIYDDTQFPVGDLASSLKIMKEIDCSLSAVISLNMDFILTRDFKKTNSLNTTSKKRIKNIIRRMLPETVQALLRKVIIDDEKKTKIDPDLARSIITTYENDL